MIEINSHKTDEFDRGLQYDLTTLVRRRQVIRMLGGTSLLALISCNGGGGVVTTLAGATTSSATPTSTAVPVDSTGVAVDPVSCEVVPEETAGPFPADGSNGPNVLSETGVVRRDIRSSFGSASGTADGVPFAISLTIQDQATGCTPLAGAAVYAWHCDRDGNYSIYSEAVADQNYLRGVQESDVDGVVTFDSIFPACYPGRWPHVHFEVYPDLASATDEANKIATSQVAIPEQICNQVYATAGYESSVAYLAELSLETDGVFQDDGAVAQLGTISGTIEEGLAIALTIAV